MITKKGLHPNHKKAYFLVDFGHSAPFHLICFCIFIIIIIIVLENTSGSNKAGCTGSCKTASPGASSGAKMVGIIQKKRIIICIQTHIHVHTQEQSHNDADH